jgi:thiol:disulfide interchange protein DsbD
MARFIRYFSLAIVGICVLGSVASRGNADSEKGAQGKRLRFEINIAAADPFDGSNEKGAAGGVLKLRRGERFRIQITGTPAAGWHSYPLTFPPGHQQDEQSHLTFGTVKGLALVGATAESPPSEVLREDNGKTHKALEFDAPFTWTQEVRITDDAPSGRLELPIDVDTLVCDKGGCTPVRTRLTSVVDVVGTGNSAVANANPGAPTPPNTSTPNPATPAPNTGTSQGGGGAKKVITERYTGLIADPPDVYAARLDELAKQIVHQKSAAQAAQRGEAGGDLLGFILAGIFWGAISLITPCVFPMIPITVSFFLKQSEKEHHRPIAMASVYSLTIVIVLTLAAAFLLQVFRWLSINPLLNYGLGALFVFFALSLFGMYDIELPSGLARFTSAREGQGGLVGTMFMALTFTIISFACIAPFLGGFGGTAAAERPLWQNLLGGLAFSATFAAPFFVLALFPSLLKTLPKSGSWLNSVKVVMGFLELAAAFKFFRGAELIQSSGDVTLFSYDLVLGIWIALSVLSGVYLLGLFHLPHDTPSEHIGVPRLLFSAAFIALGLYLAPALFKVSSEGTAQRPGGAIFAWIDAFLLPESRGERDDSIKIADLYYAVEQSRDHLKKTGEPKRIFVDFTGVICSNCRFNENNVFKRAEVKAAFQKYFGVEVYTDNVPLELFAPAMRAEITKGAVRTTQYADLNGTFQNGVFSEITLPFYAILEPQQDGRIRIVDVYGEGKVNNESEFIRFVTGERAAEIGHLAAAP